ncbi:MAG: GIDE domain-containing protein [Acidobacteriota bacterium]|nr:GIDE domain-containing protein [Acidobacteriota bacterium]
MTTSLLLLCVPLLGLFAYLVFPKVRRTPEEQIKLHKHFPAARFPEGATGKLIGRVCAGSRLLTSPLTQRPCVAWTLQIQHGTHSGDTLEWDNIYETEDKTDFKVEDNSGSMHIRMEVVDLCLHTTNSASGSMLAALSDEQREWFEKRIPAESGKYPLELRLIERLLAEGERVAVIGTRFDEEIGPQVRHPENETLVVNSLPGHAEG